MIDNNIRFGALCSASKIYFVFFEGEGSTIETFRRITDAFLTTQRDYLKALASFSQEARQEKCFLDQNLNFTLCEDCWNVTPLEKETKRIKGEIHESRSSQVAGVEMVVATTSIQAAIAVAVTGATNADGTKREHQESSQHSVTINTCTKRARSSTEQHSLPMFQHCTLLRKAMDHVLHPPQQNGIKMAIALSSGMDSKYPFSRKFLGESTRLKSSEQDLWINRCKEETTT
ncbi:MAG: hypothetical protein ACI90V_012872 [Bacillariaceae sp.]|jgi:hypothetical protein